MASTPTLPTETLGPRAAAALRDPTGYSASDLSNLSDELRAAEAAASLAAADARAAALDLALSPEATAEALASVTAADHQRAKLTTAREQIDELFMAKADAERAAQALASYDRAKAARNAATDRLRAEYATLAAQLADLLAEVMAANAIVDQANARLPPGCPPLDRVEGFVRGFPDRGDTAYPIEDEGITRITSMVLPSLADGFSCHWPPAWVARRDYHRPGHRPLPYARVRALWRQSQKRDSTE